MFVRSHESSARAFCGLSMSAAAVALVAAAKDDVIMHMPNGCLKFVVLLAMKVKKKRKSRRGAAAH